MVCTSRDRFAYIFGFEFETKLFGIFLKMLCHCILLRKRLQAFCKIYKKNSKTPFTTIRERSPPFLHQEDIIFNVLFIFIESFSKCRESVLLCFEYILYLQQYCSALNQIKRICIISKSPIIFWKNTCVLNTLLSIIYLYNVDKTVMSLLDIFFSTPIYYILYMMWLFIAYSISQDNS